MAISRLFSNFLLATQVEIVDGRLYHFEWVQPTELCSLTYSSVEIDNLKVFWRRLFYTSHKPTVDMFDFPSPSESNTDVPQETDSNMITLILMNCATPSVTLRRTDTVLDIGSKLGLKNAKFFRKGTVLLPAFSLEYQGLTDGDALFVVPETEAAKQKPSTGQRLSKEYYERLRKQFNERWADKFVDPEDAFMQLCTAVDPVTAVQKARLVDLARTQTESKLQAFRKMYKRCLTRDESQSAAKISATVVPPKAEQPSCRLLPPLWLEPPVEDPHETTTVDGANRDLLKG